MPKIKVLSLLGHLLKLIGLLRVQRASFTVLTYVYHIFFTLIKDCDANFKKGKGQTTEEHAHCSIRFMAKPQSRELELKVVDVRSRINELRTGIGSGRTQRFNKSMVYKMVSSLAQFNPEYRGIDEIILDSNAFEACSRVSFGGVKKGGSFNTHPAYIDSLSQTGGFVMNANDGADLDVEVFVNHGWKSFQLFQEISPEKSYETYVQMKECEGKTWEGDVVVLDGDSVAAIFKGIIVSTDSCVI